MPTRCKLAPLNCIVSRPFAQCLGENDACEASWCSIEDAKHAVLLSTVPLLCQVSTAADAQRQGIPERQQLEVLLHVSAASAISQAVQEPHDHVTGSANRHSAYGHAEQAQTVAHETLTATQPTGEGQQSASLPAVMPEDMRSVVIFNDGREHGNHAAALREVPS